MTPQEFDKLEKSLTVDDVTLCDDGTLDTCVEINGEKMRYSDTSEYRDESGDFTDKGWMEFAGMVLDDYLRGLDCDIE